MKLFFFLSYVLRGLVVSLGLGWLTFCITIPPLVLAPEYTHEHINVIPLPIAPLVLPTATSVPSPTPAPTSPPAPTPQIVGYSAHMLAPGEHLAQVAQTGGSEVRHIMSYNRLEDAPQAGRSLIVPHLTGYTNTLPLVPMLVTQGPTERPWVALTLDAGAGSEPTPRMLDALRERNIHITFFLTGTWIKNNPHLARQIVADGHEVANHSLTHPDFTKLSDEQIREELAETERLMLETTGVSTRPFFRPPFGAYTNRVLLTTIQEGYLPIYWTLDSLDSVGEAKTPAFLLERVTGTRSPEALHGAIILAHCGSEATAQALPAILDRFAAMGLEVRTLSEVLGK